MSDYISREALTKGFKIWQNTLIEIYGKNDEYVKCLDSVLLGIDSIPAADVRPVVRGKWEQKEVFEAKGHVDELQSAFCPVCQRYHTTPYSYYFTNYNFCPNCGADMRPEPPKEG